MDSVTALTKVRDSLRDNLTDLIFYIDAGKARSGTEFIYADEPHTSYKYPQIELKKIDNPTEVIDIGSSYTEYEQLFINIWIYVKTGFKVTISGTEYKNAQVVEYLMGQVKQKLKADFTNLFDAGVKGYKHINTSPIEFDQDTQLYFGNVLVRVFYFNT